MEKVCGKYNCVSCGIAVEIKGGLPDMIIPGLCMECSAARELERIDGRRAFMNAVVVAES